MCWNDDDDDEDGNVMMKVVIMILLSDFSIKNDDYNDYDYD